MVADNGMSEKTLNFTTDNFKMNVEKLLLKDMFYDVIEYTNA